MLIDFFIHKHTCSHKRVRVDVDEAYCPDCGELVKNIWFIVRCDCCNIKRHAHSEYNKIKPDTKYCPNCGSSGFYIEKTDKINFIDVHYAVFKQIVIPQEGYSSRQIWIEQEENLLDSKKLLTTSDQNS
ncbi:MAG: hypothetical protein LUG16_04280 [Candidatus Gastranaerophilales bacterium]|nr:hypothetical protein [Candidatus Gastranaerophilales bacterium]